jgi:hypothetical protein
MQEAARREAFAQPADQRVRQLALGRPDGRCSTRPISKSSMETKVGSPPMVRRTSFAIQSRIDLSPSAFERLPALVGERLGDARMLGDAHHRMSKANSTSASPK